MARTFSDNWYRISDLRLGLRPGVSVRLHEYRGEPWYVLHERAHAGFFRVNPATYRFLSRLSVDLTLDEVWRAAIQEASEETPGQEEVFELIAALYRANLIYVEGGLDEQKIVERFARKKRKNVIARLSELLFMRIPLWDPEPFLRRAKPWIDAAFSRPAMLLALLIVGWALVELFLAGGRVADQAEHILQERNLLLLYLAVFVSHFLHEMAHAAVCKHHGGEVRTMGVMLLMLTPLPYVDLTSSWAFRNRFHRALVDAAGMLADIVLAAVATIVWAYSPPGIVNEIAYNLMFSAAVYTLVFNINPLMRFDGYYILSDLIAIPNLHEQAKQAFNRWWRASVLGVPPGDDETMSARRRWGLVLFFVASNIYRLFVMFGIVFFVADQYFGIGLVVAIALAISSFILPLKGLIAPLRNPLFRFQHKIFLRRAAWACGGVLVFLAAIPLPDSWVLDGVVEARDAMSVHTDSGGILIEAKARSGDWVEAGQVLAVLTNPELEYELAGVEAQLLQAKVQEVKAINEGGVDLAPVQERLRTLGAIKATLLKQIEALTVRAPQGGRWVAPDILPRVNAWLARGAELGKLIDDRGHVFQGVIRQEAAVAVSELLAEGSRVRIEGERGMAHEVTDLRLIPQAQSTLPSAALTPMAGGKVPVRTTDKDGRQVAAEPFFLVRAELADERGRGIEAPPRHGRAGWIRIRLTARPLVSQAWRAASQYLQRRYQL